MVTLVEEKGSKTDIDDIGPDWAQDIINRFMFPENYKKADKEHICFNDKTKESLKYKKLSLERMNTYNAVFRIIERTISTQAKSSSLTKPAPIPSSLWTNSYAPSTPSSNQSN